jgi:DNA-binding response OmpR family regulator
MEPKLSNNERRLYDLIKQRRGRKVDSETLTREFYGNVIPINGRVYVANLIRSLRRKWPLIPEMRRVVSTSGSGRKAVEVWTASRDADAAQP